MTRHLAAQLMRGNCNWGSVSEVLLHHGRDGRQNKTDAWGSGSRERKVAVLWDEQHASRGVRKQRKEGCSALGFLLPPFYFMGTPEYEGAIHIQGRFPYFR